MVILFLPFNLHFDFVRLPWPEGYGGEHQQRAGCAGICVGENTNNERLLGGELEAVEVKGFHLLDVIGKGV